jgi:hypothetical protein
MCTIIVLYLMYNSSFYFNCGDHNGNHKQGVTVMNIHFSTGKEYFSRPSGIHSGSWFLVYRPSCRLPRRTRNLFPIYRFIKGTVNSLHKRVASVATPAKGTVPTEVICVHRPHHNASKLLMNSQFHLHKHSKISKCRECKYSQTSA